MGNNHGIDTKKDFRSVNVNLICYDRGIRSNSETHQHFIDNLGQLDIIK